MPELMQDLRFAVRQSLRAPGFTLTAVVSLALGIGAATAVFSVIHAGLIDPFPYRGADRIVRLTIETKSGALDTANVNGPQLLQLRELPIVDSVLAMVYHVLTITGGDVPENVNAIDLISTGFRDLGMPPLLGRGLLPSDASNGQEPQPVVVLSYKFWQQHFLGDPRVIGKTLQLDRKNYVIAGVAAPRFTWYTGEVFLPLKLNSDKARTLLVCLRLRPGVTHAAANAALEPLLRQFARQTPEHFPRQFRVRVDGLNEWAVRDMSGTLYLLFGAVGLLLAIGCGNLSILLLARGSARRHELAVRAAMGAKRFRIFRQLFTESLLLAAAGVVLGVLMSYVMLAGIKTLLPWYAFAPEVVIRINFPVLFFSIGVALATALLFGLWPSFRLTRTGTGQVIQTSSQRVAGSVPGRRTHDALIAGQVALTLLLLAGAGSAMEGFVRLMHVPLGFDPHNVMSVGIPLHENSYTTWAARAAYFDELRAKVAELPGVAIAEICTNGTPPRNSKYSRFEIQGAPAGEVRMGPLNTVGPRYFAALRIPLLQGRIWSESENSNASHVAVVNRAFAQRWFPGGGAIGHVLRLPDIENRPPAILSVPHIAESWLQIIGIVGDACNDGVENAVRPAVFIPWTLSMSRGTQILVRSAVPPLSLLHAVRGQLAAVNPEQQTSSIVQDLEFWIANEAQVRRENLAAWIFGVFAAFALLLAAVGLYSVVSYTVAQRTNEFGIRVALGAQPPDLLRIVFTSTFASLGAGLLTGLALTWALNTLLEKSIRGGARDPLVLIAGTLLLAFVALIACAIPARHAAAIDPVRALRSE